MNNDDFDFQEEIDERLAFLDYADYRARYEGTGDLLDQEAWMTLRYPYGVLPPAPDYLWFTYEYYANHCRYYNQPPMSESRWTALHDAYLAGCRAGALGVKNQ